MVPTPNNVRANKMLKYEQILLSPDALTELFVEKLPDRFSFVVMEWSTQPLTNSSAIAGVGKMLVSQSYDTSAGAISRFEDYLRGLKA